MVPSCHKRWTKSPLSGMGTRFAIYHIEPAMVRMNTSLHMGAN